MISCDSYQRVRKDEIADDFQQNIAEVRSTKMWVIEDLKNEQIIVKTRNKTSGGLSGAFWGIPRAKSCSSADEQNFSRRRNFFVRFVYPKSVMSVKCHECQTRFSTRLFLSSRIYNRRTKLIDDHSWSIRDNYMFYKHELPWIVHELIMNIVYKLFLFTYLFIILPQKSESCRSHIEVYSKSYRTLIEL